MSMLSNNVNKWEDGFVLGSLVPILVFYTTNTLISMYFEIQNADYFIATIYL